MRPACLIVVLSVLAGCGLDADGYRGDDDCDESSVLVHMDAVEVCNGIDDDCDGLIDDEDPDLDVATTGTWFRDADQDGFGAGEPVRACDAGSLSPVATDCDDSDAGVHPGVVEVCNDIDDDCNGGIDDADPDRDASDQPLHFLDADGDGFGAPQTGIRTCTVPAGRVFDDTDCDDTRGQVFPGGAEICNSLDDDCDGLVDDSDEDLRLATAPVWYADADGDGFGDLLAPVRACQAPVGHLADDTDCDDAAPERHPGAPEWCNQVDDDCDGQIDDEDEDVGPATALPHWSDTDGDGFGEPTSLRWSCVVPADRAVLGGDCDDASTAVRPGATEICSGIDEDCDGSIDDDDPGLDLSSATAWYRDDDGDGYGVTSTRSLSCVAPLGYVSEPDDCDDADDARSPGALDVCEDGIDQDCSGSDRTCPVWEGTLDAGTDATAVVYSSKAADYFGEHITTGDWNGDGDTDLLVGAYYRGTKASSTSGAIYVIEGPLSKGRTNADTEAVAIIGPPVTGFMVKNGFARVRPVGDVDGDGNDDFYMGQYTYPSGGLVLGDSVTGSATIDAVREFDGNCYEAEPFGDSDGDGDNEWACGGAIRTLHMYEGTSSTATATVTHTGRGSFALALASGDMDGDGKRDLWASAPSLQVGSWLSAGRAYLFLGGPSTGSESGADATVSGDGSYQQVGQRLFVGDLDDDGTDDVVASNRWHQVGGKTVGAYALFSGHDSGDLGISKADITIRGRSDAPIGPSRLHIGDVDADGIDDLIVSSSLADENSRTDSGSAWLFYGPLTSGTYDLSDADASFDGGYAYARLGLSPTWSEGLTGSSSSEILLGAYGDYGTTSGEVYIFAD